jgi:hypothetical protein
MPIVNLYRKEAVEVFTNLRFVTFKFAKADKHAVASQGIASNNYNYTLWMQAQQSLAKDLKPYLKELGISYAWSNGGSVNFSNLITVILINLEDYSLIKLMSDEYELTTSHMLPRNLPSYMFHLNQDDYEKYKDAISEAKRKFSQ